jgi:chaperonin GroES
LLSLPRLSQTRPGRSRLIYWAISPNSRSNDAMAATQTAVRIRPLHDRVIVQRIDEGEQKVGGIIIPDTAKEKPQQGKVIAVGTGKVEKDGKVTPLDVKEGDKVLFGKYSGQEIKIDGEEYLIMREEEILGVLAS